MNVHTDTRSILLFTCFDYLIIQWTASMIYWLAIERIFYSLSCLERGCVSFFFCFCFFLFHPVSYWTFQYCNWCDWLCWWLNVMNSSSSSSSSSSSCSSTAFSFHAIRSCLFHRWWCPMNYFVWNVVITAKLVL